MNEKIYFPNLDGLRFLAFFSVFLFHSGHTDYNYIKYSDTYLFIKKGLFAYGHLGVNFFFVLSGFLITYLLMHEEAQTKTINIKNFYIRRFLRIWPLYFSCLVFGFIIFPFLKTLLGQTPNETANFLLFITFLSNFNNIYNGLPDASILGVLWSVAIEEQFYIFWPILFIIFKKYRLILFSLLLLGCLLFRYLNFGNEDLLYFHTFSVISDMTIGGLVGWLSYKYITFKYIFEKQSKIKILSIYFIGFAVIILNRSLFINTSFVVFERLIFAFFFAYIILEQNFSKNSFYKISNNKFLTYWGKYTYGLYCLHFIAILITTNLSKNLHLNNSVLKVLGFETLLALILSLVLSWISFNYFEKHFLKLKAMYSYK